MCMKRTNIIIDDALAEEGMRLAGIKTYKELVGRALKDFVRREKQLGLKKLRGKIQWTGNLKEMRMTRG